MLSSQNILAARQLDQLALTSNAGNQAGIPLSE